HFLDDRANRSSGWDAHLEAFCAEGFDLLGIRLFEIQPIANGRQRCHTAEHLEGYLYDFLRVWHEDRLQHDIAGGLLRACKRTPEHDRIAAKEERLGDAAVTLDAAVGDERHAAADCEMRFDERFHLRHAEVRGQPRRAPTTRSDANFDPVDAAF